MRLLRAIFQRNKVDDIISMQKSYDEVMQQHEDEMVEVRIEEDAQRMYREWKRCIPIHLNGEDIKVYFPYPHPVAYYTVYDEDTAKYLNVNIGQLALDRYRELIDNHG